MQCSNNHGQQNFPGLNQVHEQPQLSNRRDTVEFIEIGDIQLDSYVCMGQSPCRNSRKRIG